MANKNLATVLSEIGTHFKDEIKLDSTMYSLVDIGKVGGNMEFPEVQERFDDVKAFIPLRRSAGGLNVEVDGNEFRSGYTQLPTGIFVENYVAQEAGLEGKAYTPVSSRMILSFGK